MLHEDALPALDALRGTWPSVRFGIITNGDLEFQLYKIAVLEIGERFDHIVASGALGITKPDPRIFRHAVDLFGAAPEDCAYVGDRLMTDAVGAAGAGLTGIWLDRTDSGYPDEHRADAERTGVIRITGLAQLVGALDGPVDAS